MKPSLSIQGRLAVITLNNPESANRLTVDDLDTLQQQISEVNQNQDICILVIKSTGKYFCSGFDIVIFYFVVVLLFSHSLLQDISLINQYKLVFPKVLDYPILSDYTCDVASTQSLSESSYQGFHD